MSTYRGSVSVDVDINDVLDNIDETDIISYCKEHDINLENNDDCNYDYEITIDDIDFDHISDEEVYQFIKYAMNGKTRGKDFPRTKKEMKEYCNELIDFYNHSVD